MRNSLSDKSLEVVEAAGVEPEIRVIAKFLMACDFWRDFVDTAAVAVRMLGPTGNPQARNLFEVIDHLQRAKGLHFELSLKAVSQR